MGTRRRPRNRRPLIVVAAAELFYEHGYEQVSMGDIAEAVGIGASALYRHFPGKQELLTTVVLGGVVQFRESLTGVESSDPAQLFRQLSHLALQERRLGVLAQREARNMPPTERHELRKEIRSIVASLAQLVAEVRPDADADGRELLARSVLAVLSSPSFHHHDLPPPAFEALIAELLRRVLSASVTGFEPGPRDLPRQVLIPRSRREALMIQATRLFGAHGYGQVSLDDIGASLGITAPSIYSHFANKASLLETIIQRGNSHLWLELDAIMNGSTGSEDALRRLIQSYVRLVSAHPDLVMNIVSNLVQLPDPIAERYRQSQRDYIAEWVHLLAGLPSAMDNDTSSWIAVQAALTIINDTARTSRLRNSASYPAAIEGIVARVLLD